MHATRRATLMSRSQLEVAGRNSFGVLHNDNSAQNSRTEHSNSSRIHGISTKRGSNPNGKTAGENGTSEAAISKLAASAGTTGAAAPGKSADGKPVCYVCGSKGHTGDRCKQPYCERCQQFRHAAGECSRACKKCGSLNHRIDGGQPCKNYQCKECGLYGHVYAECPNIICNLCNEYGHLARDCLHRGKPPSNTHASAASASTHTQQSAAPVPPPAQRQQHLQQTSEPVFAEDAQRTARIMDVLISRVEEYALALLADEEKLALVCRIPEDEMRAILGRANPQQNLDAAAARIEQQRQKQQQQLQQTANTAGSSSDAGTNSAAGVVASIGSATRAAAVNGPAAAGAAAVSATSSSSSSNTAAAATSNGPHKSDAAGRAHVCGRCGERGHNRNNCTTPSCTDCGRFRHTAGQCSKACRDCGGLDHRTGPGHPMCINYKCRECGLYGHVYAECPNIRCNMCGEVGHKALECPTIVCNICKQKGHKARDCTACGRCGQQGHKSKDCTGTRADIRCVHCGEWGHMASRCPRPAAPASSAPAAAGPAATADAAGSAITAAIATASSSAADCNGRGEGSTQSAASGAPAVRLPPAPGGAADSWAAAAAGRRLVTPTTVKLLPPYSGSNAAAVAAAGERRQRVLDLLMTRVEGYAAGLVAAENEVAALCRIPDQDIRALLDAPNPEQQLDAAIKHVLTMQQQETAADNVGAQPPQQQPQQQYRPAQGSWARPLQLQQQQQPLLAVHRPPVAPSESELSPGGSYGRSAAVGDTVKPAELLPQYAAALAAEFPGYFPDGWQQYASWRSLEERMMFPEPQNKSRAQYRQRRQQFQALTAQAAAGVCKTDAPAAGRAGAAVAVPAVQLQQHQQLAESPVTPMTYSATAAAGASLPPVPAADGSANAVTVRPSSVPQVRLLPSDTLDEEDLGSRFNRVLDLMLPRFESFVQSLNEDKWRLLARIEEEDLAGLLMHSQAEQQLGLLLASELEKEQQQLQQQQQQQIPQEHTGMQQQPHGSDKQGITSPFPVGPHVQSSAQSRPLLTTVDAQQQHATTRTASLTTDSSHQHGQQEQPTLQQDVQQPQQPPLYPSYPAAVGAGAMLQQQQYVQYPQTGPYMAPYAAAATGLGLNGLGIGMSVGLDLARLKPDGSAGGGRAGQAGGVPALAAGSAYHHNSLQRTMGFQQQQQSVTPGLQHLQVGLQQQVAVSAAVYQQQQQGGSVSGTYGAPFYRRSSTGTAGDEAHEQDLERMIGFLGM